MIFENWCNHLDNIINFYNVYYKELELDNSEDEDKYEVIFDLFFGYISAIGENQVGELTGDIYYGENSNFWVDYLMEDYIKYGYCLVPIIIKDNRDIPEIESELDYTQGIRLETQKELFDFITKAILPHKQIEAIDKKMAIRRNSG